MPINRQEILPELSSGYKATLITRENAHYISKRINLLNRDDSTDGVSIIEPRLVSIIETNNLPRDTDDEVVLPAKVYPILPLYQYPD